MVIFAENDTLLGSAVILKGQASVSVFVKSEQILKCTSHIGLYKDAL